MGVMTNALLLLAFVACLGCAMASDIAALRIPNWISLALVALFVGFVALHKPAAPVSSHVLVALATLTLTFVLFAANCLGAGDAKLLTALALWMGPSLIAPFLALVGILGGIFVAILFAVHSLASRYASLNRYAVFARPSGWMLARKVPYGVPICIAAVAMTPSLF